MSLDQPWLELSYCASHAIVNYKAPTGFLVLLELKLSAI